MGIFQRDDYGNRIVWGHNGGSAGGYAAQMYYCKDENSAIVFTTNSEQYIDPLVIQLFDYAGLYVQTNFATDITDTGFAANWTEASIAAGYLIDIVLDDGFSTLVDGYENLDVGNSFSFEVSGLNSNTAYFYRIRAYNENDTGAYSNTVSLTTLLGTSLINSLSESCKIWTSKKTIHIELSEHDQNGGNVTLYTLSGQQLGTIRLKTGLNLINLNIKRQPILLNVNSGGKILRKKIMIW